MSSQVIHHILQEIQRQGKITFARFMELALFSPQGGYYTSSPRTGAGGDYFTSPEAHPVFGALLALQLEQMWEILGRPRPFIVVEPGAGAGLMARDVISYSAVQAPSCHGALRYLALERWSGATLPAARVQGLQEVTTTTLPLRGVVGCVVSNELLDALPVHRFAIKEGRIQELFVTSDGQGGLKEVPGEPSTPFLQERLDGLDMRLGEGFAGEVNLGLRDWSAHVSEALERGFVLTIDYGHPAEALYSPERSRGTLHCYYRHTVGTNPYLRVGGQDITSHVDFTTLMQQGESYGLTTLGFTTQEHFLRNLGLEAFLKALTARDLPQHQRMANQMAMRQLAKPEGLGGLRVLVQGKGVGRPSLDGLTPDNPRRRSLETFYRSLEIPLLTHDHVPLLEGAYPHLAQELPWQELWDLGLQDEP